MNQDDLTKNKTKKDHADTEFSSELTGEDQAVEQVQSALFDMYCQAGNSNKEKE